MTRPDFLTLPEGPHGTRWVNGVLMDREEYDVCGWFVVKEYELDDGSKGRYWMARLDGLIRYGRLMYDRREAGFALARTRREADEEWSRQIERQIAEERG